MSTSSVRRTRHTLVAAATAAVLPFTLTACGAEEKIGEKIAEKAIEAGASGDVDVDFDGDNVKIESSDGSYSSGTSLPDNFPKDEIPLVGDVLAGVAINSEETNGWSISMQVDGNDQEALASARAALESAGFTDAEGGIDTLLVMETDRYRAVIGASGTDDGKTVIGYTVNEKP